MDRFRNIELFVTVARAGGFRAAAEVLKLPNSTVSRRIAEMERDLGLRLFNRTTRRVELTEIGRLYFARCQGLVDEAEAAHAELLNQAQNLSGLIRASLPVDFAAERISEIITEFLALYPQVRFDLDLSPRQSDLIAEPFDFVIRIGRPADSGLIQRKLMDVPIGLYASPVYLASNTLPTHPSELVDHRVLSIMGRDLHLTRISDGSTFKITPQSPVALNNVSWLKRFALSGLGLASLSQGLIRAELDAGLLVPILTDWVLPSVEVYALTESRLLPARVRVFLDYLVRHIENGRLEDHSPHDPA